LVPGCLGQWLAVGGQAAFIAATREVALKWLEENHADDPGAFVDRGNPAWKVLFEKAAPASRGPRMRVEYLGSDEELRLFYRRKESRERNEEWLAEQWPWLLPSVMGKFVGVCNQRAVVLQTREDAVAWAEANQAVDPGSLFKEVDPFYTCRTYPHHAHPW
jgi:hypothetical protein